MYKIITVFITFFLVSGCINGLSPIEDSDYLSYTFKSEIRNSIIQLENMAISSASYIESAYYLYKATICIASLAELEKKDNNTKNLMANNEKMEKQILKANSFVLTLSENELKDFIDNYWLLASK